MKHLKIAISSWDISSEHKSLLTLAEEYLTHIKKLLKDAQVILLPEYAPCALLGQTKHEHETHHKFIWKKLAPEIKKLSKKHDALILAGTAPYIENKKTKNRALLFASGKDLTSNKLALTPWEKNFKHGKKILTFKWKKIHFAVLICLDVEMPELSAQLKRKGVDIVLVPSATSDLLGSERVQRCASARAIELGALVAVSPLLGFNPTHPLVDVNVGRLEFYLPSQEAVEKLVTTHSHELLSEGLHVKTFTYEKEVFKILKNKSKNQETRPYLLKIKN